MSKAKATQSVLDMLFPEESFPYNGVTITVTPLPGRKVATILSGFTALRDAMQNGNLIAIADIASAIVSGMFQAMAQCISIDGAPDMHPLDLPSKCLMKAFRIFIDQSIDLGELRALGRTLGIDDMVEGFLTEIVSRTQSEMPVQPS